MNDFSGVIQRAKAGETGAMNQIAEFAYSYLRKLGLMRPFPKAAKRYGNSDVVQMSLVKFFDKLNSFRGTTVNEFQVWLSRIARNTVLDLVRATKGQKGDIDREVGLQPIAADQSSASEVLRRAELHDQIDAAIDRLPEDQQAAIRLKYQCQLTMPEMAAWMERSEVAVAGLIRRGLQKIRDTLRDY